MWIPGSIQRRFEEPRSYIVTTSNNSQLRRNRAHLREITVPNPATQHTRETEKSNRTTSFITTWWQRKNSINKLLGGQDRTAEVPNISRSNAQFCERIHPYRLAYRDKRFTSTFSTVF